MYELIALAVGAGLGLTSQRLSRGAWLAVVSVGSLGIGFVVSALSGELSLSWGFLVFDVGQVAITAVCVAALVEAVARRGPTVP